MNHAAPTPGEPTAAPKNKKKAKEEADSKAMIQRLAAVPEHEREFTILAAHSDEQPVLLQRLHDEGGQEMTYTPGTSLIPVEADDDAVRDVLYEAIADCKSQLKLTHDMRARGLLAAAATLPAGAASVPLKKQRSVPVAVAGVVGRTTVATLTSGECDELKRTAGAVPVSDADDADLFMHCVAKFVVDNCENGAYLQESGKLYDAFKAWLKTLPRKPEQVSQQLLKSALQKLKFRYHIKKNGRFWHGMRLHTAEFKAGKASEKGAGAAAAVGTAP
jgi:hypothetical protein